MKANHSNWLHLFAFICTVALFCSILAVAPHAYGADSSSSPESSSEYENLLASQSLAISNMSHIPTSTGALNVQSITDGTGYGVYKWSNGDTYKGHFKDDSFNGSGIYKFKNGVTLKGVFKDDMFKSGTLKAKVKKGSFTLLVKNYAPYKASISTKSGFKYKGAFKNGKLNGKGKTRYKLGGKYSGSFANGKRSGKGTYTWKSGAKYKGKWKKDAMHGKGTYYYPSDSEAKKLVGTFSKNKPKGTCTYVLRDGKRYQTYWKNGKCVKVEQ